MVLTNKTDIQIRASIAEDVDEIYVMICELENQALDWSIFKGYYSKNLVSPLNIYLTILVEGKIRGFMSCHGQMLLHFSSPMYEIQELFVQKDFRSMGLGALLILHLEDILQQKEHAILEVCSNKIRLRAHAFYLRNGFINSHYKFTKLKSFD